MPYLEYAKENGTKLVGNERYEGFVKDFMDAISEVKHFKYKLVLVPDNHYGNEDPITGKWNGMIGELMEGVSTHQPPPIQPLQNEMFLFNFREPIWRLET